MLCVRVFDISERISTMADELTKPTENVSKQDLTNVGDNVTIPRDVLEGMKDPYDTDNLCIEEEAYLSGWNDCIDQLLKGDYDG